MIHVYCACMCYTSKFNRMDCLTSLGVHAKMKFFHISFVIKDIPLLIGS